MKQDSSVMNSQNVHLSEGEHIITEIHRHPIGIVGIWAGVILIFAAVTAIAIIFLQQIRDQGMMQIDPLLFSGVLGLFLILLLLGGLVGTVIYEGNRLFLTNESAIQQIRTGLFSTREQTIALTSVEDASFTQNGIFQYLLNYGTVRLSTVGDENTYTFTQVSHPRKQIEILIDTVESAKRQSGSAA